MKWGLFKKKPTYYPADRYSNVYIDDVLQYNIENEISKIPVIFELLLTSSIELKSRTAKILHENISKLNNGKLSKLDILFREKTSLDWSYDWKNAEPVQLLSPNMTEDEEIIILGLSSFHPNGYFREKAIKEISTYDSGKEFPYLILRCNDWVKAVRETAMKYVEKRLTFNYVNHIINNLPLFYKLKNTKRNDHQELFEQVVHLLSQKESFPFLDQGTKSDFSKTRFFCYQMILHSNMVNKDMLLDYLNREKEPHQRFLLFNEIVKDINIKEFNMYYSILKRDKFPLIRGKVLQIYYSFYPEQSIDELKYGLLDKSSSIRYIARFLLKKQNITDFSSYYISVIQNSNHNLRGAILGLGEVGNKGHATLILPFLNHNCISIIKATIRSLMILDGENYIEELIEMLNHEHEGVSKEARKSLMTVEYVSKREKLYRLYKESSSHHTRYNAALLLCSLPKWYSIQYIIEFYVNKGETLISDLGKLQLVNWLENFNRTFDAPSKVQIESVKKVLEKYTRVLDKKIVKQVEFCIKGFY